MPNNFFTTLGTAVAAELAAPTGKSLPTLLNNTLDTHLNKPPTTAKDSNIMPRHRLARDQSMPVRGQTAYGGMDQDPDDDDNDGPVSLNADDCMTLLQKCIDGLDGDERDNFMEQLSNLFQSEGSAGNGNGNNSPTNGLPPNNKEAMDRKRRARDQNVPPPGPMPSMDRRRRGAMDSNITNRMLNASNFTKKWGKLTNHISVR